MKVHLHIDRLVLPDDLRGADPDRIAEAVGRAVHGALERDPSLLGPQLGRTIPAAAPVAAPPITRQSLPAAIGDAVLSTLRGPR
jgi:hypothetical protein